MDAFTAAFKAAGHKKPNFLNVAGYNVGLVAQKILETAPEFNQLAFRDAVTAFSGKLFTLDGLFRINAYGAQIGETLPVAQLVPNGKSLKVVVVWPKNVATGKAIYPTPTH